MSNIILLYLTASFITINSCKRGVNASIILETNASLLLRFVKQIFLKEFFNEPSL